MKPQRKGSRVRATAKAKRIIFLINREEEIEGGRWMKVSRTKGFLIGTWGTGERTYP